MDWPTKEPHERCMHGRLKIRIPPKEGHRYVIGADIAEGISIEAPETSGAEGGSDYTSIEVLDVKTMQQVAEWRGKWPYHQVHDIMIEIGKLYNWAFLGVERNNHGLTVVSNLAESSYPKELIYTEQILDQKAQRKRKRWGWQTSAKSKPLMIDEFSQALDEESIKIFSLQLQ